MMINRRWLAFLSGGLSLSVALGALANPLPPLPRTAAAAEPATMPPLVMPTAQPLPSQQPQQPLTPQNGMPQAARMPVNANEASVLRQLDVSAIPVPVAQLQTAEQLVQALSLDPSRLLQNMALLHRAYLQLPQSQRENALALLLKRKDANMAQPASWVDLGYAQVLWDRNKTGLFFLRKADDQLKSGASSLAYALAQAEIDTYVEQADPNTVNVRKLDVAQLITSAVRQDAASHSAGFWPVFVQGVRHLKQQHPAYVRFLSQDFSQHYVPYGNRMAKYVAPYTVAQYQESKPSTVSSSSETRDLTPSAQVQSKPDNQRRRSLFKNRNSRPTAAKSRVASNTVFVAPPASPQVANAPIQVDLNQVEKSRHVKLEPSRSDDWITVHYFPTNRPAVKTIALPGQPSQLEHPMEAVVLNKQNLWLGNIVTFPDATTSMFEDLERDGRFEIVLRQYEATPLNPVTVYRVTPQGLVQDQTVSQLFR